MIFAQDTYASLDPSWVELDHFGQVKPERHPATEVFQTTWPANLEATHSGKPNRLKLVPVKEGEHPLVEEQDYEQDALFAEKIAVGGDYSWTKATLQLSDRQAIKTWQEVSKELASGLEEVGSTTIDAGSVASTFTYAPYAELSNPYITSALCGATVISGLFGAYNAVQGLKQEMNGDKRPMELFQHSMALTGSTLWVLNGSSYVALSMESFVTMINPAVQVTGAAANAMKIISAAAPFFGIAASIICGSLDVINLFSLNKSRVKVNKMLNSLDEQIAVRKQLIEEARKECSPRGRNAVKRLEMEIEQLEEQKHILIGTKDEILEKMKGSAIGLTINVLMLIATVLSLFSAIVCPPLIVALSAIAMTLFFYQNREWIQEKLSKLFAGTERITSSKEPKDVELKEWPVHSELGIRTLVEESYYRAEEERAARMLKERVTPLYGHVAL